jgi:hypothetical protein
MNQGILALVAVMVLGLNAVGMGEENKTVNSVDKNPTGHSLGSATADRPTTGATASKVDYQSLIADLKATGNQEIKSSRLLINANDPADFTLKPDDASKIHRWVPSYESLSVSIDSCTANDPLSKRLQTLMDS